MKLLRFTITDPKGFRSLQAGFEYRFRSEGGLQDEQGFAPFICAGPNGSGKSNLLEALAAIFYHLECIYLENLPDNFRYDEDVNPCGFSGKKAIPDGFEIEYLISPQRLLIKVSSHQLAHIKIVKEIGDEPKWFILNPADGASLTQITSGQTIGRGLLPDFILGYSSGENEILSLPFFKMRFVQFDEYWQTLRKQLSYPGSPESHLVYLDSSFSQAILLCNLLFQDVNALKPFREDVGVEQLKEFRIVIKRSIEVPADAAAEFVADEYAERGVFSKDYSITNPALVKDMDSGRYTVNLIQLLEANETSAKNFDPIVTRLKRCATCWLVDEATDTLYLDYYVNDATRQAFRDNFSNSPLELFQGFQVLLTLNLYSVSASLKADLYQSNSHYVSETVPTLAADESIMRFEGVQFYKKDVKKPVTLKSLSDGEHQLLHSLGLCLLFKNTQSLFLLDEPETHFNPDWRSNFVTRLHQSLGGSDDQEMLITTHTPFLISDSRPEKVLVFNKDRDTGQVSVSNPEYNTLGASINKITMATFNKRETIGFRAQAMLDDFRTRSKDDSENKELLIAEINRQLGDSVEKMLLIKTILDSM